MMLHRTKVALRWLSALTIAASISACGADMRDLQVYIDGVKARPGGRIEALPEIQPAPSYVYEPSDRRSPFIPDTPQQRVSADPNAVQGPNPDRPREYLEQYPLDTLRMVGTLQLGETQFGLVQTSDGLIHRVVPGNYMGQNDGRIVVVSESEIELVEIISDGIGGYLEREAAVGLAD